MVTLVGKTIFVTSWCHAIAIAQARPVTGFAQWIEQHQESESFSRATTASAGYAIGRGLALDYCIYLRLISGMAQGSFIGMQRIFGLVIRAIS